MPLPELSLLLRCSTDLPAAFFSKLFSKLFISRCAASTNCTLQLSRIRSVCPCTSSQPSSAPAHGMAKPMSVASEAIGLAGTAVNLIRQVLDTYESVGARIDDWDFDCLHAVELDFDACAERGGPQLASTLLVRCCQRPAWCGLAVAGRASCLTDAVLHLQPSCPELAGFLGDGPKNLEALLRVQTIRLEKVLATINHLKDERQQKRKQHLAASVGMAWRSTRRAVLRG